MGSLPPGQRLSLNSVCIIGAGASGLAAAKYLLAEGAFENITVFEQRAATGGLWNYAESPDDRPVASGSGEERAATFVTPVYERLETNIPRDLMGFSDLSWPDECQLFPKREDVLQYIRRYAEDVQHLISFNTQVIDVQKTASDQWAVQTQKVGQDDRPEVEVRYFDGAVIANGHFDVPYIPSVAGFEKWDQVYPGTINHSKFYRRPEYYAGKRVVVVGNSASGIDIGAQIANVCQQPLLQSQKSKSYLQIGSSPSTQEKPEIMEYILKDRSLRFADKTVERDIDAILYATGYLYSTPFLDKLKPPLITTGERVENTYQHIFYRPDPTLALLVLNQKVIPFPVAEAQSAVVARVFSGRLSIPNENDMQQWEDSVIAEMGSGKSFHVLKFPMDVDYINMLHDWAASADEHCSTKPTTVGKLPPCWNEKEYWIREQFPAIKKKFQDFGEDRYHKRTLEDVGFDFERWKAEQSKGEEKVL